MSREPFGPAAGSNHGRDGKPPFWRRRWILVTGAVFVVLLIVGALSGDPDTPDDRAAQGGDYAAAVSTPSPSPTPDPATVAREKADALAGERRYAAAVDVLEDAGQRAAARRLRRLGTRELLDLARTALARGRYEVARANALDARRLRTTSAVRTDIKTPTPGSRASARRPASAAGRPA